MEFLLPSFLANALEINTQITIEKTEKKIKEDLNGKT